jgi:hypothetical protein
MKKFYVLVLILPIAAALIFLFIWLNITGLVSLTNLMTVLMITTPTLGTLLAIITAGLMFTQGKFSELISDLSNKSPDYLTKVLSLEKIQSIGTHLVALREKFSRLIADTAITKEKNLYEKIRAKTSFMFIACAVILNLKLRQQGLPPAELLTSEMDPDLYRVYQKERKSIKKDWQLLALIKQIVDVWEGPGSLLVEKPVNHSALEADIVNSVAILKLKESVNKSSENISSEVKKILDALDLEISKISKRLREDRIPQLLSQMKQVNAVRGKYFHLTVIFIAAPLLANLIILPQLSWATAASVQPIVAVTNLLSVAGVVFLLLYIYKILNV